MSVMENLIIPFCILILISYYYYNRRKFHFIDEYPSAPISKLIPHWYEIKSCITESIKYTGPFHFVNFIKGEIVVGEDGEEYKICDKVTSNPKENIISVSRTKKWKCQNQ